MPGWVKVHRKLEHSLVFKNEKCLKIWIWCLIRAGHKDSVILLGREKITLKRGSFVMGGIKAEETLDIARTTIYYWLKFLESEGMVDIKKTNKYTVVKVKNWDLYQGLDIKKTSNVTTDGHQMDTNKKVKNVKNKNMSEKSDAFESFWKAYPKKELKKKAWDIWKRKGYDGVIGEILVFIENAKKTDRWRKGYIKQPTVFLNGECWNDDLSAYRDAGNIAVRAPEIPVFIRKDESITDEQRKRNIAKLAEMKKEIFRTPVDKN